MSGIELKGLKGLRSLVEGGAVDGPTEVKVELSELKIESLEPGKYQPRKYFDDDSLEELSNSIKQQGIMQPLVVRSIGSCYEIIAGERRWRAAKLAGLKTVPVIVRDIDDNTALAFALIENIQRDNLTPIEEALSLQRFQQEFSMSHSDIAQMIGRSRSSVTNTIRLLSLDVAVQDALRDQEISMGHARALLSLNPQKQKELTTRIIGKKLTVRQVERCVQVAIDSAKGITKDSGGYKGRSLSSSDLSLSIQKKLSSRLSTDVKVNVNSEGKGKVSIQINSMEELVWLSEHVFLNK